MSPYNDAAGNRSAKRVAAAGRASAASRVDERRALLTSPITLNGERATLSGIENPFATVTQRGSGMSCKWDWSTVARVVASGGGFKS